MSNEPDKEWKVACAADAEQLELLLNEYRGMGYTPHFVSESDGTFTVLFVKRAA